MTDVDLKNALLAGNPERVVADDTEEVKTWAGVVVVRALSRREVLKLNGARATGELDLAEFEARMVSMALVSPEMTVDEVTRWQELEEAKGALEDVTEAISRLSNLGQGAQKSGVPATSQ